jgi:hypothetical protein
MNECCDIEMERPVNQTLWGAIMGDLGTDKAFGNETFECKLYNREDENLNHWHFWHKPSGLKIQWYKYPLRSPYSNMEITHEQLYDVLHDCQNSLHPQFRRQICDWWNANLQEEKQ